MAEHIDKHNASLHRPLKVFLSYASQDKPAVRKLSSRLVGEGWIETWLDEKNLLPGQDWRLSIEEAVETSDIVIICLSSHSVSKEGYVQKELRYAREIALEKPEETIFLVPLRLDECEVPRGLRFYQWVDYFGKQKETSYAALIASLKLRYEQKLKLDAMAFHTTQESEHPKQDSAAAVIIEKSEGTRIVNELAPDIPKEQKVGKPREHLPKKKKRSLSEVLSGFFTSLKQRLPKAKQFLRIAGITGSFIALVWAGLWGIPAIIQLFPTETPLATPTVPLTKTKTRTSIPPTQTLRPSATPEKIKTAVPTQLLTRLTDAKGAQMVLIQKGTFKMGRDGADVNQGPLHDVYLDAFYMDKYEVTNALYQSCVDANACLPPEKTSADTFPKYFGNSTYNNYPVVYVNWSMAKNFCEWRGARLPTEAEWEKASRGTNGWLFPWGNDYISGTNNIGFTTGPNVVDGNPADVSPYGIFDMGRNVLEWVNDYYGFYQVSDSPNPKGPDDGRYRVVRGGDWNNIGLCGEITCRWKQDPVNTSSIIGFRCAKDAQ
ncbi:MAG: SUMF1/EgtB/PvdO family nonheme iron enzyme [Anaerolineales bacterium]